LKKDELVKEANKEFFSNKKELEEVRIKAKKEVEDLVKERVKKDLLKAEYDKALRSAMRDIDGEHEIFVPIKITLGERVLSGKSIVTTGELHMINEILSRSKIEVENQTKRNVHSADVLMSGSGQTVSNTGMRRK
jgi:hypothetical protein